MTDDSIVEIADANIYTSIVELLTSETRDEELTDIFQRISSLLGDQRSLRYTNFSNVLSLLLKYTSPVSFSNENLCELVKELVKGQQKNENKEDDIENDIEEISNWICGKCHYTITGEASLLKTVSDLLNDNRIENEAFGFNVAEQDSNEEVMFKFVQSKTLRCSNYFNEINQFTPLFNLVKDYEPFEIWYRGLIKPYIYYWDNYGSLNNNLSVSFDKFLHMETFSEKFDVLIYPLNQPTYSEKISIDNWITNVILPLIVYHDYNFNPLLDFLYSEDKWKDMKPSEKYEIWYQAIRSMTKDTSLEFNTYQSIIEYFLGACYYYAINFEGSDNLSSIEVTKIYDLIKDTLSLLYVDDTEHFPDIQFKDLTTYESLQSFITSPTNPLKPLFCPNQKTFNALHEIIDTCGRLYPINKLSILKYLKLKFSDNVDYSMKEREVIRILGNVNSSNWSQLLSSARLFIREFIFVSEEQETKINKLIIERFLLANLFDVVVDFYKKDGLPLPINSFFELVLKKFWDSFNQASNLNDKIGKLHDASQCIRLFDMFSLDESISKGNRRQLIKIKHLLKAISNMKGFKIVVEKGEPFTPNQLINKFSSITNNSEDQQYSPLSLINIILEQNPKSYLAFEKLYKILNDLLLFFDDNSSYSTTPTIYFDKLKSACIESALIDNNFQFAYKQSIELFEHYADTSDANLSSIWLTFYQVGKYISPSWFEESTTSNDKMDILLKQREILAMSLKHIRPSDSSIDNSKLIIKQWDTINTQIEEWYNKLEIQQQQFNSTNSKPPFDISENIGALANEIINDATNSTSQASEKLSNLLVTGLGWAIGASQQ